MPDDEMTRVDVPPEDDALTEASVPSDGPDLVDEADDAPHQPGIGETVGKAALSTLLAASLVGALSEPPHTELMTLPEPTPIVRVYQEDEPEEPVPEPDAQDDERTARLRRLLKLLKYLLIIALIVGTIVLGALKGCASCSAGLLLPDDDSKQEQPA